MKILFHLAHPAHYHLFKNIIHRLQLNHEPYISFNKKDVLKHLIEEDTGYKFQYTEVKSDRKSPGYFSLAGEFIQKEIGLYSAAKKIKPDLIVGTPVVVAHISKILGIKSIIVNEDDFDTVYNSVRIGYPFADSILAPGCCRSIQYKNKTVTYNGYHELAYLSPLYFKADPDVVNSIFKRGNKNYIIRFSALAAHHDFGKTGINENTAHKLVERLSKEGQVFISSEKLLSPALEKYRINIDPLLIHNFLNYSDLYIGDSQTMAAEAAVLGTPSIRFNDFVGKLSYLEELEHKYGLSYGIKTSEPEKLFQKIDELLLMPNLKEEWQKRRMKILSEKIDVTAFMVWFIENYPESVKTMKENPDYQYNFR